MNTKKLLTQVKRELWENKIRLVYAPIVVSVLLIVLMGIGAVKFSMFVDGRGGEFKMGAAFGHDSSNDSPLDMKAIVQKIDTDGYHIYDGVVSGTTFANTSIIGVLFLFVLLAYTHSCLFDDRKNKDILFWRSLPVSETSNVLVKLGVIIFYIPVMILALNILVGVVASIGATVFFMYHGASLSHLLSAFFHSDAALVAPKIFLSSIFSLILLLPVIGFTLVSSAWAKKSPFLFSSVLPVGLVIIDVISQKWLGLNLHVIDTLNAYWAMFVRSSAFLTLSPNAIFFDPSFAMGLLISIAVGAMLVVGTIWLRNNRYEI